MKKKIKIEKIAEDDLGVYAKILQRELGGTFVNTIRNLKRKNLKNILKISVNSIPVGFTNFSHRNKVLYINDLDIVRSQRGKSYGEKLLKGIEKYAKRRRIKRIRLHVNVNNKSAIKFYLKKGYTIQKLIKKFYANKFDAYALAKALERSN